MENHLMNLLQHFGRDNQAGPDPASVELMAASSLTGRRLALATFTWVTYEMIITFDQSVNLFWKQKWTPSKVFFLLNRFAAVYALLVNTLQLHVVSPSALVSVKFLLGSSPLGRCSSLACLLCQWRCASEHFGVTLAS
ncbi:hypothetical protein CPB86DRAFT_249024 [Serendipita vermifera]|nr:hypothetical protein CPB86DRAFT_249024 [Serendipita vermifera]